MRALPMNIRRRGRVLASATACLLLAAGCGGGGDEPVVNNRPPSPPPPPPVRSGVFKDANVSGLSFVSGQQSGVTGADGRFQCETGGRIAFAIGAVALGETDCASLLSPPALLGSGGFDDPQALNLARFLQMLDGDEDASNGISISDGLQQVAASWPQIDFAAADLDSQLVTIISDIMSVEGRVVSGPPSAQQAFDHMDPNLACAYSGAFVGQLNGSNTGAVGFVFARNLFGFSPDEFEFVAIDPNEAFMLTTAGPYDLAVRSSIDTRPFDPSVIVQARFDSPDSLSGTWGFPPEGRSGTLNASRLGGDAALVRFAGSFGSAESRGVMVVEFNPDQTITGEAFELSEGTPFQISGDIDAQAQVSLTAIGGGETVTATAALSIDPNGTLRMDGGWQDGSAGGGLFSLVGCQLN